MRQVKLLAKAPWILWPFAFLVVLSHCVTARGTTDDARQCDGAGILNATSARVSPSTESKVVFLKTHKTGSSSVSGILWRQLCETRQRHCFLPPADHPGRTWNLDTLEDRAIVSATGGTFGSGPPFDVWVHHFRRTSYLFNVVMNQSAAVADKTGDQIMFVSIVRQPAERFRSAWGWYRHGKETFAGVGGLSLERFVELMCREHCSSWEGPVSPELRTRGRPVALYDSMVAWAVRRYAAVAFKHRTGLDATAEELVGLRTGDQTFPAQFAQLLADVAEGRVLLLVCERFEESLLVLNKLFLGVNDDAVSARAEGSAAGSPFPNLLYLRQKQQSGLEPLTLRLRKQLGELQPHDSALHMAANQALDRWLGLLYPDTAQLQLDVGLLRSQTEAVAAACGVAVQRHDDGDGDEGSATETPDDSRAALAHLDEGQVAALCASLARDNRQLVEDAWRALDLQHENLVRK